MKAHNTPPSMERISQRFQDFYVQAESHIATHISALSIQQARRSSPSPSISSKTSMSMKERLRPSPSGDSLAPTEGSIPEQQMLTPHEISDRRKARRLLEHKRVALEEAVERRVCEKIYGRIWRHRSTLDEVRDEKLRSRTAALALVGIGLPDLGVTFDKTVSNNDLTSALDTNIEQYTARARQDLFAMNNTKYPLGKLQHLAAAHKSIVDLLTNIHESSSSADEILPTLIYTLITSPPSGMNIISNLHFVQRFRNASKIDGEAAYCLTNLEAAISFLETVDLASLRSDEALEGPPKSSSRPSTPQAQTPTEIDFSPVTTPPIEKRLFLPSPATDPSSSSLPILSSPPLRPTLPFQSPAHHRRVSDLFHPSTSALSTVRTTADQGLKNITSTLDNSFNFLFGRLKEQQVTSPTTVTLPRTLDDARKLVEPKSVDDDEAVVSGASSIAEQQLDGPVEQIARSDDKLLGFFAGRPQPRDRSVDSTLSSGSGKRVVFAPSSTPVAASATKERLSESPQAVNNPIENMRNFGNSINPLKGFSGMNVMRGFGRSPSSGKETPTLGTVSTAGKPKAELTLGDGQPIVNGNSMDGGKQGSDMSKPIGPPIQRFLDVVDAGELRIGEVKGLLEEYRRLAGILTEMDAFRGQGKE